MSVSNTQAVFGLNASGESTRPLIVGSVNIGQQQQVIPLQGDIAFSGSARMDNGDTCDVDFSDFGIEPAEQFFRRTAAIGTLVGLSATGANPTTIASVIAENSTDLTATLTGSDLVVTSGDKRRMLVTGTLTDGDDPVVFPDLLYAGLSAGKPSYESGPYSLTWSTGNEEWQLSDGISLWSGGGGDFPDGETLTPIGPNTGTPTITAAPATAAQVVAAINAEAITGLTTSLIGSGTASITAQAETNFITPDNANGWEGASLDYQGEPFQSPASMLGVYCKCVAGEVLLEIDGAEITLDTGGRIQVANSNGIFSPTDTLQLTASANNTIVEVVIIASTEA